MAMLALYPAPALAKQLAIPGGEVPEDLHVTIVWGDTDQVDPARWHAAAEMVTVREPITATLSGHARFTGEDQDVIVALVDAPALDLLRRDTLAALEAQGVTVPIEHGYTCHLTLAYVDRDAPDPVGRLEPVEVTFSALSVVHSDRTDLPLTTGLGSLAREAYAQGWAASGGPLTDRVRAGCVAAVELALANPDAPGILEATLHLGHLEGVWAAIYDRREQLHVANLTAIVTAWAGLRLDRHAGEIVARWRQHEGLTEANTGGWFRDFVDELIAEGLTSDEIAAITKAIRASLLAAAAEGQVGALALSADQVGRVGFEFDLAFEHAYAALEGGSLAGDPIINKWLSELLGDQAGEVGSVLGRLTRDGASAGEMEEAVAALLDGAESKALNLGIDVLTSRGLSQGLLDLYRAEGVDLVDFISAGDQRVCPRCLEAEGRSPYRLADAPVPSIHPRCRCTLAAPSPFSDAVMARFQTPIVAE